MSTYAKVDAAVQRLTGMWTSARMLDAIEVEWVLSSAAVLKQPALVTWLRGVAYRQAQQNQQAALNGLRSLRVAHGTLRRNQNSTNSLRDAGDAWNDAKARLEAIDAEMKWLAANPPEWTGVSAAAQAVEAEERRRHQTTLIEAATRVQRGCTSGAQLNETVLLLALLDVMLPCSSAASVVSRAPSLANVFSLNSRGRAAAAALDRAANGYLATIRGSGWAARSFDVARQFTGVEQVLSTGGNRAPIPV